MARFTCRRFGKRHVWKTGLAEREVRCPCGHVMTAPGTPDAPDAPDAGRPRPNSATRRWSPNARCCRLVMKRIGCCTWSTSTAALSTSTKSKPEPSIAAQWRIRSILRAKVFGRHRLNRNVDRIETVAWTIIMSAITILGSVTMRGRPKRPANIVVRCLARLSIAGEFMPAVP